MKSKSFYCTRECNFKLNTTFFDIDVFLYKNTLRGWTEKQIYKTFGIEKSSLLTLNSDKWDEYKKAILACDYKVAKGHICAKVIEIANIRKEYPYIFHLAAHGKTKRIRKKNIDRLGKFYRTTKTN